MQCVSRALKTDEPFAFLSVCSEIHPIQLQELEKAVTSPHAYLKARGHKKLILNSRSTNPKNLYTHELRSTISLQKSFSRMTGLGKKCTCSATHKSFIFRATKESCPLKQTNKKIYINQLRSYSQTTHCKKFIYIYTYTYKTKRDEMGRFLYNVYKIHI